MSDERVERKLTAILAADVAGYSRLMGADEEGTLATLKAIRRELIDSKIAEHRGRIVKTTGDGILVEFASVVDAVRCAVEIQRSMAKRNAEVPAGQRIEFRLGINVGDVIIDGDDIFGDGVNVAARLEALAEPGEILCIRPLYEDVAGRIDARFEDIGEQSLKNINRLIRVYRVRGDRPALGDREDTRLPKPASNAAVSIGNTLRNIGYLATGPMPGYDEFRLALAAYGHIDGETVTIHAGGARGFMRGSLGWRGN
jgi:adenylate cyclase